MASHTSTFAIKEYPPLLRIGRNRVGITSNKTVKGRIKKDQGPFKSGNGTTKIIVIGLVTVCLLKHFLILGITGNGLYRLRWACVPHLNGIENRQLGLLLQRWCAAVEKH